MHPFEMADLLTVDTFNSARPTEEFRQSNIVDNAIAARVGWKCSIFGFRKTLVRAARSIEANFFLIRRSTSFHVCVIAVFKRHVAIHAAINCALGKNAWRRLN